MSNQDSNDNQTPKGNDASHAGGPPIEWPTTPHSNDSNEKAAELAREGISRAFTVGTAQQDHPAHSAATTQTHVEPTEPHTMREEPFDWQTYHSAWQQYYHRYFYQYYAGWWQQQQKNLPEPGKELSAKELSERQRVAKELKQKVRTTVSTRAKKVQSSSHFKPAVAALCTGIVFLLVNYNQVLVGAVKQYIAPGNVVTTPVIVEPNTTAVVSKDPRIIIPKIGVDVPVVYDEPKVDEESYQKALERGVVRLGTSADPGTKGNVVIGGHSSNNVFNSGGYKYAFVNLKRLDKGDIFYLNFKGKRYTYKVTVAKKIISPKDTSVLAQTKVPTVTLFTCDPPGTNINRLIVQAVQIDPSPASATTKTTKDVPANTANPLPSVAPSLWDRIF